VISTAMRMACGTSRERVPRRQCESEVEEIPKRFYTLDSLRYLPLNLPV
jgi:hypothetical protein